MMSRAWAALAAFLYCAAILLPPPAASAASGPGPDYARIDRYLSSQIDSAHIPGAALGIVHGTRIVHLFATGSGVTPRTPFVLGSLSKSFTALAVMQLAEEHRIGLDTPVVRYLPSFRVADGGTYPRITVRQLLTHTSGIPASAGTIPLHERETNLAAQVRALARTQSGMPGGRFEYSNANYEVLGLVVQSVSGEPFGAYIQHHIFSPLGMRRSYVTQSAAQKAGLTQGHILLFGYPRSERAFYRADFLPAGFLVSTATDMTHYLVAQLDSGRYGHGSVLSPAGIAALHRPEVSEGGNNPNGSRYGLGWVTSTISGHTLVWHDGSSYDMHTFMAIDPHTHWGVILLFNGSTTLYELLQLLDAVGWNIVGQVDGFDGPGTLEGLYIAFDAVVLLTVLLALRTLVTLLRGRTPSPPRWSFLAVALARRVPEWLRWTWRVYSCLLVPVVLVAEVPKVIGPWTVVAGTDVGLWLLAIITLRLLIGLAWIVRAVRVRQRGAPKGG